MFSNSSKTHPKLIGINCYGMVISIFSIVKKMVPSFLHTSAYLFNLKLNRIYFLSIIFILTISGMYIVYFECNYSTLPFLLSILLLLNFCFLSSKSLSTFLLSCFCFFFSFVFLWPIEFNYGCWNEHDWLGIRWNITIY